MLLPVGFLFIMYCMLTYCNACNRNASVVCEIKITYLLTYFLTYYFNICQTKLLPFDGKTSAH